MPTSVSSSATSEGAFATGGSLGRARVEFPVLPLPHQWEVVTGAGMALTPGSTAQGTVLGIAAGTTASAVTSLTSVQVFTAPVKVAASVQLSQKIANQSVFLELVGCDDEGVLNESDVAAWCFSGNDNLTATSASVETQHGGASRVRLANQTVPTYVAGTLTASAPGTTFEIEHLVDEASFHARASDATTVRANSYTRSTTVPDSPFYRVRVRVVNGATAPASATTVWVGHITADSFSETPVELVSSRGSTHGGAALPVAITAGAVSVAASQVIAGTANAASTAPTSVRFDALLAAAQTVKAASNAKLYWAVFYNPNAAMAAVHFYNATAPTVGTTTPILTVPVPANQTVVMEVGGIPYLTASTALTVAATTTATTAGAAAPAVGVSVAVGYL